MTVDSISSEKSLSLPESNSPKPSKNGVNDFGSNLNHLPNVMQSPNSESDSNERQETSESKEARKSLLAKLALRKSNLNPERLDASALRSLDSSIKRNSAFIKKLKNMCEEQKENLMEELRGLNLSKYVTEAVASICEAKLKSSDIPAAVQICSLLHQRYPEFSPALISSLSKSLSPQSKATAEDAVDGTGSKGSDRTMRKRSTLRLLTDLYMFGVYEDVSILLGVVKDIASVDSLPSGEKDRESANPAIVLVLSFARHARFLLGLKCDPLEEEFYARLPFPNEQKKQVSKILNHFFEASVKVLRMEHRALRTQERENAQCLSTKGELSESSASACEKLRKSYDQLMRNVTALAEALDRDAPEMVEEDNTTRVSSKEEMVSLLSTAGKDGASLDSIWDDDDTRAFYESLLDLRAFVPAVLLGDPDSKSKDEKEDKESGDGKVDADGSEKTKPKEKTTPNAKEVGKEKEKTTPNAKEVGKEKEKTTPNAKEVGKEKEKTTPNAKEVGKEKEKTTPNAKEVGKEKEKEKSKGSEKSSNEEALVEKPEEEKEKEKEKEMEKEKETEKGKARGLEASSFDLLLQRLPNCVSRDLMDQIAVEFCYLNSKGNRKKLVRTLFHVSRSSLELLPYYARLVATLSTCMKDMAPQLLQMLEEEFHFLMNKKDQINIESKIKNIRFFGELVKFKIAPPALVFNLLKTCLDDFSHHSIDVACSLLETCGRFLYRTPETSVRMANMLAIMMRLKKAKNLDSRHSTLVENAYFMCCPPERSARAVKTRPPLQQFIRWLLFSQLNRSSIEKILRQLRMLPWDEECQSFLLHTFLKIHRVKYNNVHLFASLTFALSRYHESFSIAVVDEVLDRIRFGLETNEPGLQQRRLAMIRFLGELYNYRLISSNIVFDTLYLILFFAHGTEQQLVLDPLEDCFRIRLIVCLLKTCGQFFDRGIPKKKLDSFFIYFQLYVLHKQPIPLDVEFDIQDMFAELRPKLVRFSSLEEAHSAVKLLEEQTKLLENKEKPSIPKMEATDSSFQQEESASEEEDTGRSLHDADGGRREDADDEPEEDREDDIDEGIDFDEEENVKVKEKSQVEMDPEETEAFDKEFKAMMTESIAERKLEKRPGANLNIAIPMAGFHSDSSRNQKSSSEFHVGSPDSSATEEDENNVSFRLLIKKGNKQQTKQLKVPKSSTLAQVSRDEALAAQEKMDIKRKVLEYNDREEDEKFPPLSNAPLPHIHRHTVYNGVVPSSIRSLQQPLGNPLSVSIRMLSGSRSSPSELGGERMPSGSRSVRGSHGSRR